MTEYVLGHSDSELRRLEAQARVSDPMTRRFFVEAGVRPGMRVLDVGSGAGDVALLVADLVGEQGSVVGFDRSAAGLEVARARAAARSVGNVTFVVGAADEVGFDEPFDAVVGRYVLQFQPDPAQLLARVASFARPGGVVVFHELDWAGITSDPPVPTYEQLRVWLQAAIERSGASAHSGLGMPAVFAAAGLPEPTLRMEGLIGSGVHARDAVERLGRLAPTLVPALVEYGIVTEAELDADTLVDRILAEAASTRSVVRSHLEIGAWARI
jgi:2-polyprenyl-3-methyl-5-hydroxy-6-metoxy-1,4-benzoquinol methylase